MLQASFMLEFLTDAAAAKLKKNLLRMRAQSLDLEGLRVCFITRCGGMFC